MKFKKINGIRSHLSTDHINCRLTFIILALYIIIETLKITKKTSIIDTNKLIKRN